MDSLNIICIISSIIASIITTKILATHYFEIVDDYVEDMTRKTKEFVDAMTRKTKELVDTMKHTKK